MAPWSGNDYRLWVLNGEANTLSQMISRFVARPSKTTGDHKMA